jgi:ribosomal protein S18 acetylase RimI-like enzyme
VKLWHQSQLGRGAAEGFRADAFEAINFSRSYFDPQGLILAWNDTTNVPAGFVHAGFGATPDQAQLDTSIGVVCMLVVHPDFRRSGVGRELLARAEAYLRDRGATTLLAGSASPHDPFYMGLYGGTKPAGFLESDPAARPFLEAAGYREKERRAIFFRDSEKSADPINMKMMTTRRKMQLTVTDRLPDESWWNSSHYANLDYIRFLMQPRTGEAPVAGVTVVGLDYYLGKWKRRVVGMTDVFVTDEFRGQGIGQTLLVEVSKRLKEELITGAEAHTLEGDEAGTRLLESVGFYRVDTGVVYEKPPADTSP